MNRLGFVLLCLSTMICASCASGGNRGTSSIVSIDFMKNDYVGFVSSIRISENGRILVRAQKAGWQSRRLGRDDLSALLSAVRDTGTLRALERLPRKGAAAGEDTVLIRMGTKTFQPIPCKEISGRLRSLVVEVSNLAGKYFGKGVYPLYQDLLDCQ